MVTNDIVTARQTSIEPIDAGVGSASIATFNLVMLPSGAHINTSESIGNGVVLPSERVVIERTDGVIEQFSNTAHMWTVLEDRGFRLNETYTLQTRTFKRVTISFNRSKEYLQIMGEGVQLPSGKVVIEGQKELRYYSDIDQLLQRYASDPRVIVHVDDK